MKYREEIKNGMLIITTETEINVFPITDNNSGTLTFKKETMEDKLQKREPISVPYLRNKFMIEDLRGKDVDKIEVINQLEVYGYHRGFDRAAELFNRTLSETTELIEFLKWLDSNTNWKNNPDATNKEVVKDYLNYKYLNNGK